MDKPWKVKQWMNLQNSMERGNGFIKRELENQ
jgi:hypothetical protein